jgi:hypothetical protein
MLYMKKPVDSFGSEVSVVNDMDTDTFLMFGRFNCDGMLEGVYEGHADFEEETLRHFGLIQ